MERTTPFALRACALILAAAFCIGGSAVADDVPPPDPNNGFGPNNRPAFLFVSVSGTFATPVIDVASEDVRATAGSLGTPVVMVNIGTYVAGPSIRTTRFQGLSPISIDLGEDPPDFDGHEFTIVGSFKTLLPDNRVHMMTPYPGVIPTQVQQAVFNASAFLGDPDALPTFPTTTQVALFVYDHQLGAGAELAEITTALFSSDPLPADELVCHSPCEAEGVLFPHDPDAEGLFKFHSLFDPEAGIVDIDICLPVVVDVKPGSPQNTVNAGSNGLLSIAIYSTPDFDASTELDPETVSAVLLGDHGEVVNSVPADRWNVQDHNHDGLPDVVFKFSVPALTAAPDAPVTDLSGSIDLRGETFAGMCVEGNDSIRIVP